MSWARHRGGFASASAVADAESIELERAIREVVVSSGGEVVKGLGDGVMAIFRGATAALDAAITMRAVASGLAIGGAESGLRIGISSGDLVREQGDWVGTAAIEASRLCGEAGGGVALVADSTVRLCRGNAAHELHPLGPRVLRGFADAVDVYELVAGQDDGPSLPAALGYVAASPLVGRAGELARALTELARVKTGGSTTLFIVGEPGVGKTRFAAEIAAMALADHSTVLYGRCDEGLAEPYQPISAAFGWWLDSCPVPVLTRTIGSIGGDLTALWPDLGSRLPLVMPPAELDPESRRWRLLEAVAALGRAIAASRPLILVLDDLHWAEPSTSLLLGHLVRRAIPGLAIVATVRRAEAGQRPSTMLGDVGTSRQPKVIDLAGLDEPEVSAFVTLHVGHRPPPALAKQLCRTTDGNPFFLGALLAHLASTVSLRTADGTWLDVDELAAAGVPDDIRGVIERRLAILPPAARRALDVAAVIGLAFDELTVRGASSTPLEESVDALDAAIAAGLVRETRAGRFTFVHALVRQTVLDDLSQTRRARLHWRIAEQLEGAGYADRAASEIAHHYAAGVDVGDPDTVVRWTMAAADAAMTGTAFDEATGHLRTALAALDRMAPDLPRRYDILRSLGQALNALADYRGSEEAWLAAADLARQLGDPDRLFATVVGYGYVVRVDGDDQLVRMLDDVLALAGPDDSAVRACALGWRAVPALSNGGLRSTSGDREMVEAAVGMAERTGDRSAVAATLRSRLLLLARSGDAAGMLRDAETLALAGPVGGVTITRDTAASLRDYAAALLRVGRRSDAERHIGLAKAEAGRNGLRMAMGSALILESALATASGRFGDGKRLAARAVNESQPDNVVTQLVYAGQIHGSADGAGTAHRGDRRPATVPGARPRRAGVERDAGHGARRRR